MRYTAQLLPAGLCLTPVLIYFFLLGSQAANAPHLDDYDSVLRFVADYLSAGGWREKLALIFAQHNDHRIAVSKLFVLLQYALQRQIDFRSLIFIGNLSVLGTGLVCWHSFRCAENRLWHFIPAACLLFNFTYYEAALWAMVSLSGLWVIFLSLAGLACLGARRAPAFLAALGFSGLAVLAQGNGKLILVAGLFLLVLQRRFRPLLGWLGASAGFLIADHFLPGTFGGYDAPLATVLARPGLTAVSFFTFLGAAVPSAWGAGLLGIGIAAAFLHLTVRRLGVLRPVLYVLLAWVFLNAAGVAYTRPYLSHPSRYRLYSCVALALVYLGYVEVYAPRLAARGLRLVRAVAWLACLASLGLSCGLPFFFDCYQTTSLDYERRVVYACYETGRIDRTAADAHLAKDLQAILQQRWIQHLPAGLRAGLAGRFQSRLEYVTGSRYPWWLPHVPRFAEQLKRAQKMDMYDPQLVRP